MGSTHSGKTPQNAKALREALCNRLAEVCLGRENHSDLFLLRAVRCGRETRVHWIDEFTGERALLATLAEEQAGTVLAGLFPQLRHWRQRCANAGAAPKAMTAGGAR